MPFRVTTSLTTIIHPHTHYKQFTGSPISTLQTLYTRETSDPLYVKEYLQVKSTIVRVNWKLV